MTNLLSKLLDWLDGIRPCTGCDRPAHLLPDSLCQRCHLSQTLRFLDARDALVTA